MYSNRCKKFLVVYVFPLDGQDYKAELSNSLVNLSTSKKSHRRAANKNITGDLSVSNRRNKRAAYKIDQTIKEEKEGANSDDDNECVEDPLSYNKIRVSSKQQIKTKDPLDFSVLESKDHQIQSSASGKIFDVSSGSGFGGMISSFTNKLIKNPTYTRITHASK